MSYQATDRGPGKMSLVEARAASAAVKRRTTIQLDSALADRVDRQAFAEGSNRAAIVRKSLRIYIDKVNGVDRNVRTVIVVSSTAANDLYVKDSRPGEHAGGRVTIQLDPDLAAEVDEAAEQEDYTRAVVGRKAIELYLDACQGKQTSIEVKTLRTQIGHVIKDLAGAVSGQKGRSEPSGRPKSKAVTARTTRLSRSGVKSQSPEADATKGPGVKSPKPRTKVGTGKTHPTAS